MQNPAISFFESLEARVAAVNSLLCVGLDPHESQLVEPTAEAALSFCMQIVESTHNYAAAFKPNSAFFEAFGPPGIEALIELVSRIHQLGVPVVLDVKRGDIESTALAYAQAAYDIAHANAVTLSPYMGYDSVQPFVTGPYGDKGVFMLCKTSNRSSAELQDVELSDGGRVFDKVSTLCSQWDQQLQRENGDSKSRVGLVLGATDVGTLRSVRRQAPSIWVLCPGVGAQGGQAEEVCAAGLRADGSGLLVSVSRGISNGIPVASTGASGEAMAAAALRYRDMINTARGAPVRVCLEGDKAASLTEETRGFISLALQNGALRFGSFTLKSGRVSPFFFNAGMFCSGGSLSALSRYYARAIRRAGVPFDAFFGPAYKGIPLASCVASAWFDLYGESKDVAYNRKEEKTHGEGGCLVGAPLQGRRVLIIDDVITAGTAIRESMKLLCDSSGGGAGAIVTGVVVALDRQERATSGGDLGSLSAIQQIEREVGIAVVSVARLADLVAFAQSDARFTQSDVKSMQEYRQVYGVSDY